MERNRCAHCRNPIRHGGDVPGPSSDLQQSWFHPDCWATVHSAKQKDYVRAVETRGLEALLAPYISAVPTESKAVGLATGSTTGATAGPTPGPTPGPVAGPAVAPPVAHVVAQGKPTDLWVVSSTATIDRSKSA